MSDHRGGSSRVGLLSIVVVTVVLAGALFVWLSGRSSRPSAPGGAAATPPVAGRSRQLQQADEGESGEGGTVEGRVVGPDGRPVSGAAVTAVRQWKRDDQPPAMRSPMSRATTTAGDGAFRLDLPASGTFTLAAAAGGFSGAFQGGIEVAPRARIGGVELRLGKPGAGAVLSGRLLDAGGGPIPGGRVHLGGSRGTPGSAPPIGFAFDAAADGQGHYRVEVPQAPYTLEAQADGYASIRDFVDLRGSETRDFRLEPAARLSGRVVTAGDQRPVSGAEVTATTSERRFDLSPQVAITDDEGRFRLDGLPGGSFDLTARKGELVGAAPQTLSVASGGNTQDLVIPVGPGVVLSGMVKGRDGKPVPGAQLSLNLRVGGMMMGIPVRRVSGRADGEGRFRLTGLLAGTYALITSAEGRPPKLEDLSLHQSLTRDVVLDDSAVVSGVVLAAAGQPAAGAEVEASVHGLGGNRMGSGDHTVADAQGRFRMSRMGAGTATIRARKGDETAVVAELRLEAGEPRELTIKLQAGGRVSGQVTWEDGSPARDLKVVGMQREGSSDTRETRSGPDGAFTVGPFTGGDISVVAVAPGDHIMWSSRERPEQTDLTIAGGEHRSGVKLVVTRRTGTIAGLVVGPDGQPVAGASVSAAPERDGRGYKGNEDGRSVTGPDGAFLIEALRKGSYTLWARSSESPEAERRGVATGARDVRIALGRAASVAGMFVGADGRPVSSYTLMAVPPGKGEDIQIRMMRDVGTSSQVVNDARGAFQLARLTAGHYDLVASAPDGQSARAEVSVSEGEKKQGVRLVAQGGVTVEGRVVEVESGAPLPGMEVRIRVAGVSELHGQTDAQGAFRIANVPVVTGTLATVAPPERTHVPESFAIPPGRDGRADVGTIRLLKFDPSKPNRGRLGLNFGERDGKMVINDVLAEAPAARAGLRVGDVLISVDGHGLTDDRAAATAALRPRDPEQEIKVVVQTPGQEPRTITLKRSM
jgi:hypothetical protein